MPLCIKVTVTPSQKCKGCQRAAYICAAKQCHGILFCHLFDLCCKFGIETRTPLAVGQRCRPLFQAQCHCQVVGQSERAASPSPFTLRRVFQPLSCTRRCRLYVAKRTQRNPPSHWPPIARQCILSNIPELNPPNNIVFLRLFFFVFIYWGFSLSFCNVCVSSPSTLVPLSISIYNPKVALIGFTPRFVMRHGSVWCFCNLHRYLGTGNCVCILANLQLWGQSFLCTELLPGSGFYKLPFRIGWLKYHHSLN